VAVTLNRRGYDHAQKLVADRRVEIDERDDWSEHQPSADAENRFIEEHGMDAFARWHLGQDDEKGEDTKGRWKFPYGDFDKVHRCGVLSAESRAAQYGHQDIEVAAAHLHGAIDALASAHGR
jgi:hypothetical protein